LIPVGQFLWKLFQDAFAWNSVPQSLGSVFIWNFHIAFPGRVSVLSFGPARSGFFIRFHPKDQGVPCWAASMTKEPSFALFRSYFIDTLHQLVSAVQIGFAYPQLLII
jgi:hypothetical protein